MSISHSVLTGFRFYFTCGELKAGFQKIGGIGERMESERLHEGGQLGFAIPIRSTKSATGKLTFEKGHGIFNPFYKRAGAKTVFSNKSNQSAALRQMGFVPGAYIDQPCSIIIMGEFGSSKTNVIVEREDDIYACSIRRIFAFDYGLVTSWETSPLDANSNEILIDKVEIEHTGLYEVDIQTARGRQMAGIEDA